jgi:hypothetical protein
VSIGIDSITVSALHDGDGDGVFDGPIALDIAPRPPERVSGRHDGERQSRESE